MAGLSTATRERFDALVATTLAPPLRQAGYRKVRLTWFRPNSAVAPVVDVQKGLGGGTEDLIRFTCNWGVHVAGYEALAFGTTGRTPRTDSGPLTGRIGGFLGEDLDAWWRIAQGKLGRWVPPAPTSDDAAEAEIAELLASMIEFLDGIRSIDAVLELLARRDKPGLTVPGPPGSMVVPAAAADAAVLLRALAAPH